MKMFVSSFRFPLIELLIVLIIAFMILPGCTPQQIKADVELKIANDVKPVAVKDLREGLDIATKANYVTGVNCSQGMLTWFDALPAPRAMPGTGFCAAGDTTSADCQHVDGLVSGAIAIHVTAQQAQTAPVALPPIDDSTRAYCLLMFADTSRDVNQALAKFGALAGGLALGKGTLGDVQAKAFAAGLAQPKP